MAHYVDGFVIPLPKKNVADYRRMAQNAGKYGETTARSNSASASATTWTSKWESRLRVESKPSPAIRYCSPTSCSSRVLTVTESTPKS